MREGFVGARRRRLAASAAALVLAGVVLASAIAEWPLAGLARQSVNAYGGGAPFWEFAPFAVVGVIVAWWRPRNPLGWILVGLAAALGLSEDGSFYAVADYRLRHGTLPVGWVAMFAQPGWAIAIVLIGVAVLIFPDGTLPSPRLRWVLWLYLALGLVWMGSAYVITADAVLRHAVHVDASGNLVALDNGASSPGWWNVLQDVVFGTLAVGWLLTLAGQAASYRRSSGERRQQLKWLLGGFAACLAGVVTAVTVGDAAGFWHVVSHVAQVAAIIALPVTLGVAILKYRLYDIDRIISRTLAYAIVTGLLVGMYAGLVLLAQQVLRLHSTVAVAAATLAAAALFNPVRRRVQHVVDRRFNRTRYDADRAIGEFAARLQDAVDLDAVRGDLAGVVQAALEPSHVSVWTAPRD
ncbi:MAG TPA: hypothetical protein VMA97_12015 [Streptosporangiaceae bacterium]|nr:hypothetical protein [Streptosporangiaceae bacterium]